MSTNLEWHPAANIFPLLSGEEFDDLVADIRSEGLHNPIVLHDGKVLDGRNRLLACHQAGVEPRFVEWDGNGSSATSWVISLNLQRRHLNAGQRAAVAVEAKPLLEGEAKQNQRLGGDPSTFVNFDKPRAEPIHVRSEVAKQFDVSSGYVHAVQKIKETCPETFEQVKAGSISIPEAQRQLGMKQTVKNVLSSDSNEWYTPSQYVEAAREVMGGIDLDPASNELANTRVVKATEYFTLEDDGLKQEWHSRVWLNPPYGDVGPQFVAKLIEEYEAGNVTQAILLVNPRTDTAWFQPLFDYTLCFTAGRIRFWKQDGSGESPTTGSVLVYLGSNQEKFIDTFSRFGSVLQKAKRPVC